MSSVNLYFSAMSKYKLVTIGLCCLKLQEFKGRCDNKLALKVASRRRRVLSFTYFSIAAAPRTT
jgi:hypothetical protein